MRAVSIRSSAFLQVLDVRPTLARGDHPVDEVLAAADALAPGGVVELIVPFEPRPLMQRLVEHGCTVQSFAPATAGDPWVVRAGKGGLAPLRDYADLEAPEPLERVLADVTALPPGTPYLARLPRNPVMLVPQLEARGLEHALTQRPDGSALLWARRAPA